MGHDDKMRFGEPRVRGRHQATRQAFAVPLITVNPAYGERLATRMVNPQDMRKIRVVNPRVRADTQLISRVSLVELPAYREDTL
jgi:hypothetical protein